MAKGYLIGQVNITNLKNYKEYAELVPKVVKKYGGKYLVRGGKTEHLEGNVSGSRNVVMEFKNVIDAKKFYDSEDYKSIINIRTKNSNGFIIIVEGTQN